MSRDVTVKEKFQYEMAQCLWKNVKKCYVEQSGEKLAQQWIEPLYAIDIDMEDKVLVLECPNEEHMGLVAQNNHGEIEEILSELMGEEYTVEMVLPEDIDEPEFFHGSDELDRVSVERIWRYTKLILEDKMINAAYNAWVEPLDVEDCDPVNRVLKLVTDTEWNRSSVTHRYRKNLEDAISDIMGEPYKIEVRLLSEEPDREGVERKSDAKLKMDKGTSDRELFQELIEEIRCIHDVNIDIRDTLLVIKALHRAH